jgi:hypothetical protein
MHHEPRASTIKSRLLTKVKMSIEKYNYLDGGGDEPIASKGFFCPADDFF